MPPRRLSRYAFCEASEDESTGDLLLSEPEPFRFVDRADTRTHIVDDGDTLFGLAGRYFSSIDRAAGLYWVIADFQPTPILDPTVRLTPGSRLFIPSVRTVLEEIFSERRRAETAG